MTDDVSHFKGGRCKSLRWTGSMGTTSATCKEEVAVTGGASYLEFVFVSSFTDTEVCSPHWNITSAVGK